MVLFEYFQQSRVLVFLRHTYKNRQSLRPVVCLTDIIRGFITCPRPVFLIEILLHLIQGCQNLCFVLCLSQHIRKTPLCRQCQEVPLVCQQFNVDIASPVRPTPAAFTDRHETTFINLPYLMEIFVHSVVQRSYKMVFTRIIILGIKAVHSQRHQHLNRQFLLPVSRRNGRENNAIGLLPVHQLMHTFIYELPGGRSQHIDILLYVIYHIPPPLRTLPIGAIKVGVTHIQIQGAGGTLP